IGCFADATGSDLTQFLRWYRQAGTPEGAVTMSHDAKAKTCTLQLAQMLRPTPGQSVKEPMVIPLAVGLIAPDGRDLPLTLADGRPVERGVLGFSVPPETSVS